MRFFVFLDLFLAIKVVAKAYLFAVWCLQICLAYRYKCRYFVIRSPYRERAGRGEVLQEQQTKLVLLWNFLISWQFVEKQMPKCAHLFYKLI